jgi:hypothetical protein
VKFEKDNFKKVFPNLAKEMESEENKVSMNSARTDTESGEKAASKRFSHYMPDTIDFIRRCDTDDQARDIIAYMEKRGEINTEYARRLRKQLKDKGVRSFGSKKEENFYLKHGQP